MKKISICLFYVCCATSVLADHHFVITKETPQGKEIFEENVQKSPHHPLKVMILQFQNKGPLTPQNTLQIARLIAQSLGTSQNNVSAPHPLRMNFQEKPHRHHRKKHCSKHSHHQNNPSQEKETPEISKKTPPSFFQTGHFFDDIKALLSLKDKVTKPSSFDLSNRLSSPTTPSQEEPRENVKRNVEGNVEGNVSTPHQNFNVSLTSPENGPIGASTVHNLAPFLDLLSPADFPAFPLTFASDVFQPSQMEAHSEKSPRESDTEKSSTVPQTPEKNASFDIFQEDPFDEFLE